MKVKIGKPGPRGAKTRIQIDEWDTWSLDVTLSQIIVPALQQLKATQHGGPRVDDEDVPVEIRRSSAAPVENEWDTDDHWFARWDWVLDEMIWAHRQVIEHDLHEFWTETPIYDWDNPIKLENGNSGVNVVREGVWNHVAHEAHEARVSNGLRLFSKYYRALWD